MRLRDVICQPEPNAQHLGRHHTWRWPLTWACLPGCSAGWGHCGGQGASSRTWPIPGGDNSPGDKASFTDHKALLLAYALCVCVCVCVCVRACVRARICYLFIQLLLPPIAVPSNNCHFTLTCKAYHVIQTSINTCIFQPKVWALWTSTDWVSSLSYWEHVVSKGITERPSILDSR